MTSAQPIDNGVNTPESQAATGMVPVWLHVAPEHEEEFHDWYEREHVAQVVGLEGFVSGRRYVADGVKPKFLCLYETRDAAVADEPAFQHLVTNPTPWSSRIWTFFQARKRQNWRRLQTSDFQSAAAGAILMRDWRADSDQLVAAITVAIARTEKPDGILAHRCFQDVDDPDRYIEVMDLRDAQSLQAPQGAAFSGSLADAARQSGATLLGSQLYVATGAPYIKRAGLPSS